MNVSDPATARAVAAKTPHARPNRWPVVVMLVVLYVVAVPPVFFLAARTGLVRDVSKDRPPTGPVDACIAPARWLYEDSPLQPVLQPWAEFWYDVLLT